MDRLHYFIRRLLLVIPTFIGITLVCFGIINVVPGGPVEQLIMQMKGIGSGESRLRTGNAVSISEEQRKTIEKHFGFDKPFSERYWNWLIRDRIGLRMESYKYPNKTAWQLIRDRFPVSLIFGLSGLLLSYAICIPLGIAKALRNGSVFDLASSMVVFTGYAIPALAFGMVLKMMLCGTVDGLWDFFPLSGFHSDLYESLTWGGRMGDIARHMFLPVLCYVIGNFAVLTLLMKNSLLDQIGMDYVRTILAKGGSARRAVWGHALRNAMIPLATGMGGLLSVMFAGSVLIEQIFEIPGMGRLSLDAIMSHDYPVFMGILSLTSVLALAGNIFSDLCYVLIDPRIDFQS
jgi:microcin C transport system permease protein